MADIPQVIWHGAKGQYTYYIYQLPASFTENQAGNYIYTKIFNNTWVPIYIGQGDLSIRTNIDSHHQGRCLKSKGVTHVHVHRNSDETIRISEESDLLAGHSEAYQPTGCNEKSGG